MARYIDADALIDRLKFKRDTDIGGGKYRGLESAISQVQKQLIVDLQAVVRCKDCVYAFINNHHESKPLLCALTKMCGTTDPMWFCADGERRDS